MAILDDKARVRRDALARRDAFALDVELAMEAALRLRDRVIALMARRPGGEAGPVAGYWPIRSEIDPRPIMQALAAGSVVLALPVIEDDELSFRAWKPWEPLVPGGGFGTLGPSAAAPIVAPRTVLAPLAAFDRSGGRLGYGKGYYDRALMRLAGAGPVNAIGLAYACQEVPHVPMTPQDRRLDAIVTELETIEPLPSRD